MKTFGLDKKRSLLKPMMIVSTTESIITRIGPFFSDLKNTGTSLMKNILLWSTKNILNWNRGFRDTIEVIESLWLNVPMVSSLDSGAISSGRTELIPLHHYKIPCIAKAANWRMKQLKYFAKLIKNSSLIYVQSNYQSLSSNHDDAQYNWCRNVPEDITIN